MIESAALPHAAPASAPRRALLVLGMHRSGTSALARVLSLLGGELPRTLMPAQADNPEGFWESLPISRANERWLRELGRDWSDPRPLPENWREQLGFETAVREATGILEAEFPVATLWIVKDPRLCRLAPVWLEALKGLDVPAAALLCLRDPLAVAASLGRRNGLGVRQATLGWARHLLDAERYTRGLPRALLDFEALLWDWRHTLESALTPLGLEQLPECAEAAATVDEFLDHGRPPHHRPVPALSPDQALPESVRACRELFRGGLPPSGTAALDAEVAAATAVEAWQAPVMGPPSASIAESERRLVLIHFHLAETHGAPLDGLLQRCLGEGWLAHEGSAAGWATENVRRYLERHRRVLALSSATARLPVPVLEGVEVVPLLLLAHPLERVRALHAHDLRQSDPQLAATAARGLAAWVDWRLQRAGDRAIRDPQTQRLAWGLPRGEGEEYVRARRVLEALPWVGLHGHPGTWLPAVEVLLRRLLPSRRLWLPEPPAPPGTLAERLQALATELGEGLYARLREANARDLALYAAIASRSGLAPP